MTLRINHNGTFKTWDVEYFAEYRNAWVVCEEYYRGKNTYAAFKTREEAVAFMEWKNNKSNAHTMMSNIEVPANYYGVRGCYYGD